jgi:two-component sensor histidine kinase
VSEELQPHRGEARHRQVRAAAARERDVLERLRGLEQRNLELTGERDEAWDRVGALEDTLRGRDRRIEQAEFLFREAAHRMQNTFAALQGMAERTARAASSTTEFMRAFRPRLIALVRAHEILGSERWAGARLGRLVRTAVEPYLTDRDQLVWQDDDVMLPGRSASPLFMALHELATNAAKHGALSVPTGRVRVEASVDPEAGAVRVAWQESGGPAVAPVVHEGFGLTVIRRGITHELGGGTDIRFEPTGVHATLTFPFPGSTVRALLGGRATDNGKMGSTGS